MRYPGVHRYHNGRWYGLVKNADVPHWTRGCDTAEEAARERDKLLLRLYRHPFVTLTFPELRERYRAEIEQEAA